MKADKFKDGAVTLSKLVERSLKIFLKDKVGVFFSLLAPLIVLVLYVLFLGDIQMDGIKSAFEGAPIDEKLLRNFVDSWMLAGVVSVACITVSFSAQGIMIQDKEKGVLSDMLASPVSRGLIETGYLISNFVVTLCIRLIVLAVAFIYLAITGWRHVRSVFEHTFHADMFGVEDELPAQRFCRYHERGYRFSRRSLYAAFCISERSAVRHFVRPRHIFGVALPQPFHERCA